MSLGKFGLRIQNCLFKVKFNNNTNSNMQNSIVMFILFVLEWKHPFWANLVQIIKIVGLNRNVVLRLIPILRMVMFIFSVFNRKYPFLGNFSKILKLFVEAEI